MQLHRRQLSIVSEIGPDGRIGGARINQDTFVDLQCASSLIWVEAVFVTQPFNLRLPLMILLACAMPPERIL